MTEETEVELVLADELKKEGLELTEDVVVKLVEVVFRLIPTILTKSTNPLVNGLSLIAVPLLAAVKAPLLGIVDGIDGQDNPDY